MMFRHKCAKVHKHVLLTSKIIRCLITFCFTWEFPNVKYGDQQLEKRVCEYLSSIPCKIKEILRNRFLGKILIKSKLVHKLNMLRYKILKWHILSVYLILFQQKLLTVKCEGVGRKLQSKKMWNGKKNYDLGKKYFLSYSKTGRSMRMDWVCIM